MLKDELGKATGVVAVGVAGENGMVLANLLAADLELSRGKLVRLGGSLAREIGKKKVLQAFGKGVEDPLEGGLLTFRELLMQYTDNEVVHGIFDAIILAVLACRSWELPVLCPELAPSGKHLSYYCGYPPELPGARGGGMGEDTVPEGPGGTLPGHQGTRGDTAHGGPRRGQRLPRGSGLARLRHARGDAGEEPLHVGEGVRAPGWSGTNKAAQTAIEVADAVSRVLG